MKKINILMVGVDKTSKGGMLTIADVFINSRDYNQKCKLYYVATATRKGKLRKAFFFLLAFFRIFWLLMTKHIDIVHVHMAEKASVYRKGIIIAIAKAFGCKIVVQMHAGPFMDWYGACHWGKQKLVKKIINMPDKFLVLGEYWCEQYEGIIKKEKLGVLYNGVEVPAQNQYNIMSTDISFFAMLKKTKGIFELLKAIEKIKDKLPEGTCVNLCGLSDEFDIEDYLEKNNLKSCVKYHGWVEGTRKKSIQNSTAICVLPTYVEGLSMTILEAMSIGIPIVTTNVTTMPELLGGIVDMVEPMDVDSLADLLLGLIWDKEKRKQISSLEYERVNEKFSNEKMIYSTLDYYAELMAL